MYDFSQTGRVNTLEAFSSLMNTGAV